jgi:pimeloyl-ACP methyl ester carboxylesterase
MRIENDGVRLYLELEGSSGPAVVYLHGAGSSARSWSWLPADVTAGRRTIRIDLRGHGRSDRAARYDVATLGSDVLTVLDAGEATTLPVTFVGHSLGGVVAWWISQHRPDRVTAALLVDPPLLLGTVDEFSRSPFHTTFSRLRSGITALRTAELTAEEIAEQIGELPVNRSSAMTLRDQITSDALDAMAFSYRWLDVAVLDSILNGQMMTGFDVGRPLGAPITVLRAEQAAALSAEHARRLTSLHPGVEVVVVPGGGHAMHEERAGRPLFLEHLNAFLTRHAPIGDRVAATLERTA